MAQTLFFYDLETTGTNPRTDRVMQFAGQRTTLDLEPIGEPYNILIALTPDVVPEPDAILVTGITPQQTIQDGITEAEFLKIFCAEIVSPDTVFIGYNTIRFDDEFMRYMLYRNFYDPYEWQWKDGCSRWDLLDVVRMTRALRPDGIVWPKDNEGKPTNRLELLTSENGLDHAKAHDALSDVSASIALAKLLKTKQPKLYNYLFAMRDKRKVAKFVSVNRPFVYSSGKYASEFEKTTVVVKLADHSKRQGALVYDLRYNPEPFIKMTPHQLVQAWSYKPDRASDDPKLPIKMLRYNCCPAVAPLSVLDSASQKRIGIYLADVDANSRMLISQTKFIQNIYKAIDLLDAKQTKTTKSTVVDAQLYDGFFSDNDKVLEQAFRQAEPEELSDFAAKFKDKRLQQLAPLYKARNFSSMLTAEERETWERYLAATLLGGGESSRLARYFTRLAELANQPKLSKDKQYLLEELQIYGQSIMPETAEFA